MPSPRSRYKFSHPDIPICQDRLRQIIAEGDAAEEARSAAGMRLIAAVSRSEPDLAQGRDEISTLSAELTALRLQRDRLRSSGSTEQAERLAGLSAQITETTRQLADAQARASEISARQIAAMERRRRVVTYALERGLHTPEVLRSIDQEGRPL